ncbi:hypothetical protein [Haloplanus aerogenes]|uniref:Glutamyl-tRNA reductase n=1 Tax=Haloplanus aerogenes TaxID=660522 RepID=A0A3M0E090_9EURY|nr:hypothetical protein [Haloplanus aerogenes]AZH25491.1 hypothetical protein DU502_08895 [Haloplanus aerogenes]RMB25203.1 hypothetical protein ATH50_0287 [Haloplanus aerogenes]
MATQPPLELDGCDGNTMDRDGLDRRLRRCGVAVAERELRTALTALDDLTPAQRRIVARMAGRIAAGVLAPAREAAAEGEDRTVARLFDPERIRD